MNEKHPVETKVKTATAGAGVGAALAGLACWVVDAYVHTPGTEGDLPGPITAAIVAGVAAGVAWAAGYVAKHSPRPARDA